MFFFFYKWLPIELCTILTGIDMLFTMILTIYNTKQIVRFT